MKAERRAAPSTTMTESPGRSNPSWSCLSVHAVIVPFALANRNFAALVIGPFGCGCVMTNRSPALKTTPVGGPPVATTFRSS
jgi:hypothetical protein